MKHRDKTKQLVHDYFRTHGYEETVSHGKHLGAEERKIRRWMRKWQTEPLEDEQAKPA